ncbi:copper homeostasis protein CutC [uncultured Negativibacillus sp.]|uniref:copper homeostasis protein CutC n=1 Tax=uncultured Negativibacillus sp. TaxID=1980696 RepID=UPI0025CFF8B3|nr:copper homeostasis protein CutC [uncultured Negativibacillus sp.]
MKKPLLECCVDTVESALAAKEGGADRLELCANLLIGGTTPDINLYHRVRETCDILINVLIRPRFGDFCYSDEEFEIIRRDVKMFREAGADGVVIGVLKPDGSLDMERMEILMKEAGNMSVTLHRAFDVCSDPMLALQQAKQLHIDTILTAGQKNNALDGEELLCQLVKEAAGEVDILIGSGVKDTVIAKLAPTTGATSFHMSGKITLDSPMTYRKSDVSMGLPMVSEYTLWQTSAEEIRKARTVLDECCRS